MDPRTVCPVCGGADLAACLDRDSVPVFQNALYSTAAEARAAVTGRLAIRFCRACGFGFNAAFDADLVTYGANYENDQTGSRMFSAHVDQMAGRVLAAVAGRSRPVILEVGCGQGYFLERLANLAPAPLGAALGFDPSFRGVAPPPLKIQARVFDRAAAEEIRSPIDAVVSRHVIEHISEPVAFLEALRAALPSDGAVELFLETPCVEWILAGSVVQDFFYEHCNYFTVELLAFCLRRAGFTVGTVERVFGEQYLWARARPSGLAATAAPAPQVTHLAAVEKFAADSGATAVKWSERLKAQARLGKVALWGAAGKGVTFASIVDPEATWIDCLIDVNPRKQGHFIPVTAHPVLSAEAAAQRGVRAAVIMNPNYAAEIAAYVRERNLPFALLGE